MIHVAATFRFMLALIVGLGAPVWCCCAAQAEAAAAVVPACHQPDDVPPCHPTTSSGESEDRRGHECACGGHFEASRLAPDERVALVGPSPLPFLLDLPPTTFSLSQPPAIGVMLLDTGPPPRPDTSLFDLHCMLTI